MSDSSLKVSRVITLKYSGEENEFDGRGWLRFRGWQASGWGSEEDPFSKLHKVFTLWSFENGFWGSVCDFENRFIRHPYERGWIYSEGFEKQFISYPSECRENECRRINGALNVMSALGAGKECRDSFVVCHGAFPFDVGMQNVVKSLLSRPLFCLHGRATSVLMRPQVEHNKPDESRVKQTQNGMPSNHVPVVWTASSCCQNFVFLGAGEGGGNHNNLRDKWTKVIRL